MAKKPTVPLKITAYFKDGRINSSDGVLMFDSIVYHAWFCKYIPERLDGQDSDVFDKYFHGRIGLPLKHISDNRWCASKGIYTEIGKTVEHINKRPDFFAGDKIDRLKEDKGIISESAGAYRAYRLPQVIRTLKDAKVVFYAMGHKDKLEDLLGNMFAIGKKSAIGYGQIKSWKIEECEDDYTLWHPEYGLMRPVEVGSEEAKMLQDKIYKYPILRYAIRPPYWKQKNFRLCHVPIKGETK